MFFFLYLRAVLRWAHWVREAQRTPCPKSGWVSGKGAYQFLLFIYPVSVLSPHALCFRGAELILKKPQSCTSARGSKGKSSNTLWKATDPWLPGNARRHRAVRSFVRDILIISCICGHLALWHARHNWGQKHTSLMKQNRPRKQEGTRTRKHKFASHT